MTDGNRPTVIGIIGGSGVYDIEGLTNKRWKRVESPFVSLRMSCCSVS